MKRKKFREYNQDQQFLVPPDIRDWVPEDDFARFIDDLVNVLDLSKFEEFHKPGTGQPPYDPTMMVKVILYCFCTGVYSSRKMERATYRDLGARFLAANQHPDYTSFYNFGKRHSTAIKNVFVQVVMLCTTLGLADLGHISIDGTRMKGNASRSKNVLASEIDELIRQGEYLYAELSKRWEDMDEQERKAAPEIPETLAKSRTRIKALEDAKAQNDKLEAERLQKAQERAAAPGPPVENHDGGSVPSESSVDNAAEPDLLTLKQARRNSGLTQSKLAEATGITQSRISSLEKEKRFPSEDELERLCNALGVDNLKFKERPVKDTADKGKPNARRFINLSDPYSYILSRLGKESVQGFNSQAAVDSKGQVIVGAFVSLESSDRRLLIPMLEELDTHGLLRLVRELSADCGYYSREALESTLLGDINAFIPPDNKRKEAGRCPVTHGMREKMNSETGKAARKTRSKTVEPVFGRVKTGLGFSRFLSRGIENVSREWSLICTAHNILKILPCWKVPLAR